MSGRPEVAEEVTQEAFITLARELARYDAAAGFGRCLFVRDRQEPGAEVARTRSRRMIGLDEAGRRLRSRRSGSGPLEEMLQSEAAEAVRRAVLALPESYREAVVLCDLQELSYARGVGGHGLPGGHGAIEVEPRPGVARRKSSRR